MKTVSQQEFVKEIDSQLDVVHTMQAPLLIQRPNGQEVVVLSKEEFSSWEETMYLLSSPENAERFLRALHREPNERIIFNDIDELKNAIGI